MDTALFKMPVLIVDDITRSRNFYQSVLGLKIENDFGANIVFMDSISIWDRERAESIMFGHARDTHPPSLKGVELYFESPDLKKVSARLKATSVKMIHGIKEEPWGQRTIRFFDPDGFIIEVAEPLADTVIRLSNEGMMPHEIAQKVQLSRKKVSGILEKNG